MDGIICTDITLTRLDLGCLRDASIEHVNEMTMKTLFSIKDQAMVIKTVKRHL